MKYNTITIDNGLRIIHLQTAAKVVYCGYQIAAGTRDEEPGMEGLAHFCEHVSFKGTQHRKAWQVLNCLESVGGELNAFTTKERTVYYAAILNDHIERAIDLLTDIVFCSQYPQNEIDKEVEVIAEEIESYNDTPSELIYDEFENILFRNHPLGHNILGDADRVRKFTTSDALSFTRKHYLPQNAIFFVSGDVEFKKVLKLLSKVFGEKSNLTPALPQGKGAANSEQTPNPNLSPREGNADSEQKLPTHSNSVLPSLGEGSGVGSNGASLKPQTSNLKPQTSNVQQRTFEIALRTHQSHVMTGAKAFPIGDKRNIALSLLNNILGGPGMNARLNVSLREHHGLVYTVESSVVAYQDTGVWCVYFGCDAHDINRCLRLVRHELDAFLNKPLTKRQLDAAKKQMKGQLGIAADNRENFALGFGKTFLLTGKEKHIADIYSQIDAVSAEEIQQIAQQLFDKENMITLIIK